MKAMALTFKGMEDIAAQEIFEITGKKSRINNGFVLFETNSEEDLCRLCYLGQSFIKILAVIGKFKINRFEESRIKEKINKCKLSRWISKDKSFAARAIITDKIDSDRQEIEA